MDVPYMKLRMLSSNILKPLDPVLRRNDEVLKMHVFPIDTNQRSIYVNGP